MSLFAKLRTHAADTLATVAACAAETATKVRNYESPAEKIARLEQEVAALRQPPAQPKD